MLGAIVGARLPLENYKTNIPYRGGGGGGFCYFFLLTREKHMDKLNSLSPCGGIFKNLDFQSVVLLSSPYGEGGHFLGFPLLYEYFWRAPMPTVKPENSGYTKL